MLVLYRTSIWPEQNFRIGRNLANTRPAHSFTFINVINDHTTLLPHHYFKRFPPSTFSQTPEMYEDWLKTLTFPEGSKYPRTGPFAYDAALAIALALNDTVAKLNGSRLEDFDYDRSDIGDVIKQSLQDVYFEGVTVKK